MKVLLSNILRLFQSKEGNILFLVIGLLDHKNEEVDRYSLLVLFVRQVNQMDDSRTNNNRKEENSGKPDKYGTSVDISKDYDTILEESAVLTTVSGFLFAFLLNISIDRPSDFSFEDGIILMIALFTITFATSLLSMPVFYHHLQYPYRNIEKVKLRSHRFANGITYQAKKE